MKKLTQKVSVVALCLVMIVLSMVPAFAVFEDATYTENHDVIDCVNRYKEGNNEFHFTVKIPKGYDLRDIGLRITYNSEGTSWNWVTLAYVSSKLTYLYSDDTHDYYEWITGAYAGNNGVGLKLYCKYNGNYYMATDNANGQTTEGRGYWLSA